MKPAKIVLTLDACIVDRCANDSIIRFVVTVDKKPGIEEDARRNLISHQLKIGNRVKWIRRVDE